MKDICIINTHSHCNMIKETPICDIIDCIEKNKIVTFVPSSTSEDMYEINDFIKQSEYLYGYVGVFPEEAHTFEEDTLLKMESLIKNNNKIIGIGEIGLDYYWDKTTKELQKEIFIKQIEFANQMNMPMNIHDRDAHGDTIEILKKYNKNSTAILHCYSGSLDFAKECINLGIYISIGGVVTFKNANKLKEVAKNIPIEYMLLETDDPYLAPVPLRGKENHPEYVEYVAEYIANLRGIDVKEIKKITKENALKIFKI